jgi:hypothetical protein
MTEGEEKQMDYYIALQPNIGLTPADFVAAWNDSSVCREVAEARVTQQLSPQYDPNLLTGAVALLGSVALGLATNALYDLIKQVLVKQHIHKRTEIMQHDQPDGSRLLIVTVVEEYVPRLTDPIVKNLLLL